MWNPCAQLLMIKEKLFCLQRVFELGKSTTEYTTSSFDKCVHLIPSGEIHIQKQPPAYAANVKAGTHILDSWIVSMASCM